VNPGWEFLCYFFKKAFNDTFILSTQLSFLSSTMIKREKRHLVQLWCIRSVTVSRHTVRECQVIALSYKSAQFIIASKTVTNSGVLNVSFHIFCTTHTTTSLRILVTDIQSIMRHYTVAARIRRKLKIVCVCMCVCVYVYVCVCVGVCARAEEK
jgi:hypothetical protein